MSKRKENYITKMHTRHGKHLVIGRFDIRPETEEEQTKRIVVSEVSKSIAKKK